MIQSGRGGRSCRVWILAKADIPVVQAYRADPASKVFYKQIPGWPVFSRAVLRRCKTCRKPRDGFGSDVKSVSGCDSSAGCRTVRSLGLTRGRDHGGYSNALDRNHDRDAGASANGWAAGGCGERAKGDHAILRRHNRRHIILNSTRRSSTKADRKAEGGREPQRADRVLHGLEHSYQDRRCSQH